jgi:phage repressor protein C with HTH and peptisase S24 domain
MRIIDRLDKYMNINGLNDNQVTVKAGLGVGTLGKTRKEGDLSIRSINKILRVFNDISGDWLLYGEGEMLKNTDPDKPTTNQNGKGVKYFDVDFIAGFDIIINNQQVNPAYYIDFKPYNKADYWVNVTGHSMDPLISHGDIIAIKKLNDWKTYYLPGEIYAIVTDEFRTIKKIRKGDNKGEVLLVPENLEDFDPKPISISLIRDVYQVLGCMKKII